MVLREEDSSLFKEKFFIVWFSAKINVVEKTNIKIIKKIFIVFIIFIY